MENPNQRVLSYQCFKNPLLSSYADIVQLMSDNFVKNGTQHAFNAAEISRKFLISTNH